MSRHDDDDLFDDDDPGSAGPASGLVYMVGGVLIMITSVVIMFYETMKGLSSHSLHAFQFAFLLVMIFGLPVLALGVWLFNRGKRIWKH